MHRPCLPWWARLTRLCQVLSESLRGDRLFQHSRSGQSLQEPFKLRGRQLLLRMELSDLEFHHRVVHHYLRKSLEDSCHPERTICGGSGDQDGHE